MYRCLRSEHDLLAVAVDGDHLAVQADGVGTGDEEIGVEALAHAAELLGGIGELIPVDDLVDLAEFCHEVLLVLDASTGQNAFQQAKEFSRATDITAMAITKLDGTAKGGVVLGISDQFKIPVRYIGLGEGMEHLQVFDKQAFVETLFGE